ncbi:MAG: uroporphyrinogen decarboxylase family protein, partial [Clostridia bacterium]
MDGSSQRQDDSDLCQGMERRAHALYQYVHDDCRWITADSAYHHPEGRPALDPGYGIARSASLGSAGCFAEAETIAQIERYPWPDPNDCDFTEIYRQIDAFPDQMIFTGMWSPFFHNVADFFGMENYFVKMYEYPAVVEAATEHIVDYYVATNDRFFAGLQNRQAVMFFGNDFGTQNDLFLSPVAFRKFVLPSFRRLVEVGKKYGRKVMLHSCGSIYRVIPDLIDVG